MAVTVFPMTREPAAHEPLTLRRLLRFYAPLALNALLVTLSGPVLNVAIGRAREPGLELAAFWTAFTIVLFAQSTCLITQQITVALARDRDSLRALSLAALAGGVFAAAAVLAVARTPLGDLVFAHVIPTTVRAAARTREVLARLAPIPVLVSLRGVANGIAIARQRTLLPAVATVVRLMILAGLACAVVLMRVGDGALGAAGMLVAALTAETVFLVAALLWRARAAAPGAAMARVPAAPLGIVRVAAPVAVATLVWISARPAVSAVLGRLPDSELALAGFGVVLPLLLITCSPLWTMLEVALVLPRRRADLARLIRFAAATSAVFALAIAAITVTPLRDPLLRAGFHLPAEIERAVLPALGWLWLAPFFVTTRAVAQSLLMRAGRTRALLVLSPVKLLLQLGIGLEVVTRRPDVDGVMLAVALVIGGDAFDALTCAFVARGLLLRGEVFPRATETAPPAARRSDLEVRAATIAWTSEDGIGRAA